MPSKYGSFKGLSYRVCYGTTETGNMDFTKPLYEFHKDCKCGHCKSRFNNTRGTYNELVVTVDDKSKFQAAFDLIANYVCNSVSALKCTYIRL